MPQRTPRIAVILDENTSGDATRYEASKGYFRGVHDAGGLPFGIPYHPAIVDVVLDEFDGVLAVGGRYAYPAAWYAGGETSRAPASERLVVERAIVEACLARGKPILGTCAGMQMLAGLHGCRLSPDLRASVPQALEHDKRGVTHRVTIAGGTHLHSILSRASLDVNSFHREAVIEMAGTAVASAHAEDGVIEAIEIPSHPFAIGLQWHQELFVAEDHPGNVIFHAFVAACGGPMT